LNHLIENKLAPATGLFEQNARQACDKLQSSYPSMSMGESGSIVIRTRQGNECIIGSAGGAAAAAAGVGLAAAGSAAAAASAAAATAMTITVPTALSTILPGLGATIGTYFGVPTIGGAAGTALGSLATGTAVVTAPAAAAPLWVVLAGPVGWTLAGLGVLAVPFSWRLSKVRLRNKLEDLSRQQVEEVFKQLREDRIPQLRKMGLAIVEDFNLRLDRQISQIETSLTAARDHRDDGATATQLNSLAESLREHLDKSPTAQANAVSSGSS
jgi:hypothetical protein